MMRKSRWRIWLGASIASVVVLSGLEIALRLTGAPCAYTSLFTFDSEMGYRLRPGNHLFMAGNGHYQVRVDGMGVADSAGGGKASLVILGDGVVAGLELPHEERLAAVVSELTGRTVTNLSVPGYGTLQQWLVLRRWLEGGGQPDMVVVVYNYVNDFFDNMPRWEGGRVPGITISNESVALAFPELPSTIGAKLRHLIWNSRLYGLSFSLHRAASQTRSLPPEQLLLFGRGENDYTHEAEMASRVAASRLEELSARYGFRLIWVGWHDYGMESLVQLTQHERETARSRLDTLLGEQPVESRSFAFEGSEVAQEEWERKWLVPGTRHANSAATAELASLLSELVARQEVR